MHWVRVISVFLSMRQLLLVVVAPAKQLAVLGDRQGVTEPTNDLFHLSTSRERHVDWLSVPCFKERRCHGPSFSTSATLSKGVITHAQQLSFVIQEEDMIQSTSNLRDLSQILNLNWSIIDHQLAANLTSCPLSE